jgi:hypothetical protein
MKRITKNKKADIPIVVLVLGVFFICMMVLGSFYFFQNRMDRTFIGTGIIEKAIVIEDKYYFYKSTGKFTEPEIEKILGIQTEGGRKYIELTNPDKSISIKYYLPEN